jgi:hypothetical protein
MPIYTPIVVHPNIKASHSNLIELQWEKTTVVADFIIPDDSSHALRIRFDRTEIIRILDEMPISTEYEETPNEGLVPENFAYIVEGTTFWKYQSETLKTVKKELRHYRFITGWTCLDVISKNEPTFSIISTNSP